MLPNLRPRGIGEVLDAAVNLYRRRFGAMVALTAVAVVPVQILSVLVTLSTRPDDVTYTWTGEVTPTYGETDAGQELLDLAGTALVLAASVLATAFATAAVTRLVAHTYLDLPVTGRESARAAFRRIGPVIGLGFIVAVTTAAGYVACLIPGLWLQISWSIVMPALLIEGLGVGAAMGRSFSLTKLRWWHCAGVYWAGNALVSVFGAALGALFGLASIGRSDSIVATVVTDGIGTMLAQVLTQPLVSAALVALYFDLRIRGEGFDVQMAIQRLGAPQFPAAPAVTS